MLIRKNKEYEVSFANVPSFAKLEKFIGFYRAKAKFISEITTEENDDVHYISIRTIDFFSRKPIPNMFWFVELEVPLTSDILKSILIDLHDSYIERIPIKHTLYGLIDKFKKEGYEKKSN